MVFFRLLMPSTVEICASCELGHQQLQELVLQALRRAGAVGAALREAQAGGAGVLVNGGHGFTLSGN
ncbi:hypothetical protein G6F22_020110 [Rhizopus arrhizus]|nr:hypothetical protein G6F22_020110 [Rhizopus arrhizus]KAG1066255.1 hypothetical protein G6F40_017782 [Rhizopus arrhizus]